MTPQEQTPAIPPYVPYRTFQTFLEFLLEEGIPGRIDKTVWGPRFSGSSGTQLMTALKVLELVDSEAHPDDKLDRLVHAEGEERRVLLRDILEGFYKPVFELDLSRASKGQFRDAFRRFGTKEGVLTKCEAFFIRAAQAAGIKLSQRILAGRHGAGRLRNSGTSVRSRAVTAQPVNTVKTERVVDVDPASQELSTQLELADRILAKYPDFDPAWDPSVQTRWLEGMTRLYEGLSVSGLDRSNDREIVDGDIPLA